MTTRETYAHQKAKFVAGLLPLQKVVATGVCRSFQRSSGERGTSGAIHQSEFPFDSSFTLYEPRAKVSNKAPFLFVQSVICVEYRDTALRFVLCHLISAKTFVSARDHSHRSSFRSSCPSVDT